jgi:hypothetical protein
MEKSNGRQRIRMQGNEIMAEIKACWNESSAWEWYRSLRTEERIKAIRENPASAFHPAGFALMGKYLHVGRVGKPTTGSG